MDVDGEVFTVKISPLGNGGESTITAEEAQVSLQPRELPDGAILCGAPGLILSILVGVGDEVAEGGEIATIETMKMRRSIVASCGGVVREVLAQAGQMVAAEDVLMVVA